MTFLFRTPTYRASQGDSFLVTIFDTTAPMWREFDIMIQTHESVFQDYPKKQNFYMTKECVEEFKQFSLGAAGDITNALLLLYLKLKMNLKNMEKISQYYLLLIRVSNIGRRKQIKKHNI